MSRNTTIALIIAVVLVAVVAAIIGFRMSNADTLTPTPIVVDDGNQVVCTMEARMCPDGSFVGRTGPNCEFAACPNVGSSAQVGLNQTATISGHRITPLEIVEDSRCPTDVQCIQAGTVRVRTQIGSDPNSPRYVFTLSVPQEINGTTFTLAEVSPTKLSTQTVRDDEYRFGFTVK